MPARPLVLDNFIPYRLSVTANMVSQTIARAYEALFGLSIPQWRLVAVLAESGGINQAAIGVRTRMDKVTVSRAAIALARRGLLTRVHNPEDGRSHLLELTAAGRALYAAIAPKALEFERRIFDPLDTGEVERFVTTLRRIEAITLTIDGSAPGD